MTKITLISQAEDLCKMPTFYTQVSTKILLFCKKLVQEYLLSHLVNILDSVSSATVQKLAHLVWDRCSFFSMQWK